MILRFSNFSPNEDWIRPRNCIFLFKGRNIGSIFSLDLMRHIVLRCASCSSYTSAATGDVIARRHEQAAVSHFSEVQDATEWSSPERRDRRQASASYRLGSSRRSACSGRQGRADDTDSRRHKKFRRYDHTKIWLLSLRWNMIVLSKIAAHHGSQPLQMALSALSIPDKAANCRIPALPLAHRRIQMSSNQTL